MLALLEDGALVQQEAPLPALVAVATGTPPWMAQSLGVAMEESQDFDVLALDEEASPVY